MAKLLIIRLSSFGDIVLTEPIARTVKHHYPGSHLWFVTSPQYSEIPGLFSSVDTVVTQSKCPGEAGLDRIARKVDFDVVIDLQGNMRSRRITRNVKAGTLVRHRRQQFRRFLTVYAPWIWRGGLKSTVESYADTLKPLGLVPYDLAPVVTPPEERVNEAAGSFGEGPFVGICPGGSSSHKRWGESQFVDLISDLRDRGQSILVLGSEADRPVVQYVVERADGGDVAVYVGNDVGMIAALLSMCTVTVTNDSGLMHLAGAVGSQLVSIFGPTSPLLGFAPVAQGAVIVTRGLTCSPCSYHGNKPCKYGTRQCLEEIDPLEVAGIVSDMAGGKIVG